MLQNPRQMRRILWAVFKSLTKMKWIRVLGITVAFTIGTFCLYNSWSPDEDGARILENNIRMRLDESEAIWKKGVAIRHKTEVERPSAVKNPWTPGGNFIIWDFFYATFNCPHSVERLGRAGDGGKWVCGINHLNKRLSLNGKSCVVYSYGVAGDTSFEEDILARTPCTLRAFDHTVDPYNVALTKRYPQRSTFDKVGLGVSDNGMNQVRTLMSQMDVHGDKFIDILKVDVEGGEFELFPQILNDFPEGFPFGQLLIELHLEGIPDGSVHLKLKTLWEMLEGGGLRPFRSEPNLYVLYQPGKKNPICFEFSFLNVKVDHTLLHA